MKSFSSDIQAKKSAIEKCGKKIIFKRIKEDEKNCIVTPESEFKTVFRFTFY